jgi:hypothetical protein
VGGSDGSSAAARPRKRLRLTRLSALDRVKLRHAASEATDR